MSRDELIKREREAIQRARSARLVDWQIQMAYFVAMHNNRALRNGRCPVVIRFTPGNPPTWEVVEEAGK